MEIASGIKCIWELETLLTPSAQIIEDIDGAFEALEIF